MNEECTNINLSLSAFEAGVLMAVLIKDQVLHPEESALIEPIVNRLSYQCAKEFYDCGGFQ